MLKLAPERAPVEFEIVNKNTRNRVTVSAPITLVNGEELDPISGASWAR